MSQAIVLAVGMEPSDLKTEGAAWGLEGYAIHSVGSIHEAINQFQRGDFDLVLLGRALSSASKERLTFLIRASDAQTPVICLGGSLDECEPFADATLQDDSQALRAAMNRLLAARTAARATAEAVLRKQV